MLFKQRTGSIHPRLLITSGLVLAIGFATVVMVQGSQSSASVTLSNVSPDAFASTGASPSTVSSPVASSPSPAASPVSSPAASSAPVSSPASSSAPSTSNPVATNAATPSSGQGGPSSTSKPDTTPGAKASASASDSVKPRLSPNTSSKTSTKAPVTPGSTTAPTGNQPEEPAVQPSSAATPEVAFRGRSVEAERIARQQFYNPTFQRTVSQSGPKSQFVYRQLDNYLQIGAMSYGQALSQVNQAIEDSIVPECSRGFSVSCLYARLTAGIFTR